MIQEQDGNNSNRETEDNVPQLPPTPTTNGTEVAAHRQPNLATPSPAIPPAASQPAPQTVARVPPPELTEQTPARPGPRTHFILAEQGWTYYRQTNKVVPSYESNGEFAYASVQGHLVSGKPTYHLQIFDSPVLHVWSNEVHFTPHFRSACDHYINEQRLTKALDPCLLANRKGKYTSIYKMARSTSSPTERRGRKVINEDILTAIRNRPKVKSALKTNANNIMDLWDGQGTGPDDVRGANFQTFLLQEMKRGRAGDRLKLIHELTYRYQVKHEDVLSAKRLKKIRLDMMSIESFRERGTPTRLFTKGQKYLGNQLEVLTGLKPKRK